MKQQSELAQWLNEVIVQPEFHQHLTDSLVRLCTIDSTPEQNAERMRLRERQAFETIMAVASRDWPEAQWQYRPMNYKQMRASESYTPPYYTSSSDPYAERSNLVMTLPAAANVSASNAARVAVNAHIDTVPPHIAPKARDGRVFARGACDDKGNVVVMLGALRLLNQIRNRFGLAPRQDVTYMFVIDEESGGNGSLALALDRDLKRNYDELVVVECCENVVYCANRGAVWFRAELPAALTDEPLKLTSELVLALEASGRRIREESEHPLFLSRPVQTCHGIWGPWGEHPSRVCGYVEFTVRSALDRDTLQAAVNDGVSGYTSSYGDKTQVTRNGKPVVPWHVRLEYAGDTESGPGGSTDSREALIQVMGSTGHMAAVAENDGALTKAAYIIDAVNRADPSCHIKLEGHGAGTAMVLEGGQSFIPTHTLSEVKERIWSASASVLGRYGVSDVEVRRLITMDKLHNSAFCSDPESPLFRNAREFAAAVGLQQNATPQGWGASCDARLFAEQYSHMPIITMGAGDLNNAHSDTESIGIEEVARNAALLALLLLQRSGATYVTSQ